MSAGRRGLLLSVAFFGLAVWLCANQRLHAQPQILPARPVDPQAGRHTIWQQQLSPDQVKHLLSKFGQGDKDADDLLTKLIRDQVKQKNPNVKDEQLDAAIKKLLADKDFMNRVTDIAQKHKNQNPNEVPKFTPEDIAKLKNVMPKGPNGDPFKVPNEQLPNFDPKLFPRDPKTGFPLNPKTGEPFDPLTGRPIDPKVQRPFDPDTLPNFDPNTGLPRDPNTGFPLDPKTKRPFDPNTGVAIDPKNPPKFEPPVPPMPPMPKFDPMNPRPPKIEPPKIDPKTGQPAEPPNPNADPNRKFDPDNPLGTPKDSPEKMAKTKAVETATALWEKNVGPIDESPAVKRAILDLVSDPDAMDALTDDKGNSIFDMLKDTGDGSGMGDLFGGGGSSWEWPKLDLGWGKTNTNVDIGNNSGKSRWPEGNSRWPSSGGSSMGGMGSFSFGGMQVPWMLALIVLALITAALLWWKWNTIFPPNPGLAFAGNGAGPWPLDPREINTREDVVKAFEYLSVLICGPSAKMWTHSTIADELMALAATHGETAVKLARLYELARYAPLDEPLTRAELLEARRLVCDLAGVDEA